jgi:hypothetical protein
VTGPQNGTVSVGTDGSFIYNPVHNYTGPDSFTYKVTDPAGLSDVATVNITVN